MILEHKGLRLRVRIVPSSKDVTRLFYKGERVRRELVVHGYFLGSRTTTNGEVVLPIDASPGLIAHECNHAVMNYIRGEQTWECASTKPCIVDGATEERACAMLQWFVNHVWDEILSMRKNWRT